MVEDRLRKLIVERYGSMIAFSKSIGMANSTLATIMERGVNKASINNIIKICEALGISADSLAHGQIVHNKKPQGQITIEAMVEDFQNKIISDSLTINGVPMTEEEKENMATAIGLTFDCLKMHHKKQKTKLKG